MALPWFEKGTLPPKQPAAYPRNSTGNMEYEQDGEISEHPVTTVPCPCRPRNKTSSPPN